VRPLAAIALLALAACSQATEPEPDEATAPAVAASPAAPSKSAAEALITKYTWPGPNDPRQSHPKEDGPFAPRDDCGELDGAYEFRLALAEAVLAKDTDALLALAAPDIKLDFGGSEGHAEWRSRLAVSEWRQWEALAAILPLGCEVNEDGGLTLPWYFAQDLPLADPYMAMMVIGEGVPLLAGPGEGSKAVAQLSWDVVTLDPDEFDGELGPVAKVQTLNGKSGWIAAEHLRSFLDYRLIAEKGAQGWRITAFVAGD
jgi:hypothetical protein